MRMIQQTALPIKLERSHKPVTPRGGLILFDEWIKAYGVQQWVEEAFSPPGSNRGYAAWRYIEPLVLMLYGGGRHIENLRELREDAVLQQATGMGPIPCSSAVGDWLVRQGQGGGIQALERVNRRVVRKALKQDPHTEYTLWSDPTLIEAEKQEAAMSYAGVKGYRPMVTAFKELPLVVWHQFKAGNEMGGAALAIAGAYEALPAGKRIRHAALDSEFYTAEVIQLLRFKKTTFTIVARQDEAVRSAVEAIAPGEWRPFRDRQGVWTDREIAETIHCLGDTEAFRLVVLRWRKAQGDLFGGGAYCYHAIATDLTGQVEQVVVEHERSFPPEQVVYEYNERGQMENILKELKSGVGMEQMPSGDFGANAMYFGLGVLTYNLFVVQKYFVLPEGYRSKTIATLRWALMEVAGWWVRHGRRGILKLSTTVEKFKLYLQMRQVCLQAWVRAG